MQTNLELTRDLLSGYVSGPTATTQATARAQAKVGDARVIVLVEGISDQIALDTLVIEHIHAQGARPSCRLGADLTEADDAQRVAVNL